MSCRLPHIPENPIQRRLQIKAYFTEIEQCIEFIQQSQMNKDEMHRVLCRLADYLDGLTQEYTLLSNDKYRFSYITNEFLKRFSGPVEIIEFDKKLVYLEVADFGVGGLKTYFNAHRRFLTQKKFAREHNLSQLTSKLT